MTWRLDRDALSAADVDEADARDTTRPAAEFEHPALFYADADEYVGTVAPFLRAGLAAGEAVCVAAPERQLSWLRSALGPARAEVGMLDMTVAGANPNRIIPQVLRAFADAHADARVRIVGEPIWVGREGLAYQAALAHEALINLAFAGRAVTILCPYELALGEAVLADAARTHPTLWDRDGAWASDRFDPDGVVAEANQPMTAPPHAPVLAFDRASVGQARRLAAACAAEAGLSEDRAQDFVLAVDELATNTVLHGGGEGTLRVWREGADLVGEVRDRGRILDPLVGRHPVDQVTPGGRGLLMVNRVADLVRMHSDADGATVRVHFTL